MKISTINTLLVIVIILLSTALLFKLLSALVALLSSLAVALSYFYCARKAKKNAGATFWFAIPAVLFTLIPLLYSVLSGLGDESSLILYLLKFMFQHFDLIAGALIPIILLLIVHHSLAKHEKNT